MNIIDCKEKNLNFIPANIAESSIELSVNQIKYLWLKNTKILIVSKK